MTTKSNSFSSLKNASLSNEKLYWNYLRDQVDDNLWNKIDKYNKELEIRKKPGKYEVTAVNSDPSLQLTLTGHSDIITDLDFSYDGSRLASVSLDSSLYLWKLIGSDIFPLKFLHHELGGVNCVKFANNFKSNEFNYMIATGGVDKCIRILTLRCSDDDNRITALQQPFFTTSIKAHQGTITDLAFSGDSRFLVSSSEDLTSKLWSIESEKYINTFCGHKKGITTCDMATDGRVIASGGKDKSIKLFDINNAMCITTLNSHTDAVNKVVFSTDGTCLASCSSDNSIKIYDLRYSGKLLQQYNSHAKPVNSIDFHPSGNYLISCGEDNTIKIWNLMHSQLMYTIEGHYSKTQVVKFSRNGGQFASASDKLSMVWQSGFNNKLENLCRVANKPSRNITSL
ncbi:hypothetical protein ABK040_007074 [Willaertia magna]